MAKDNVVDLKKPETFIDDPITDILRSGARQLLAQALEIEISSFLSQYADLNDDQKAASRIYKTIRKGLAKLQNIFEIPFYLILRFYLVQFVSFWFSLGWMVYKMTIGWYAVYAFISMLSFAGVIRLIYEKFRNGLFKTIDMKVVSILLLLFVLTQLTMIIAYGPSTKSSISHAMGRSRFMEIGAVSILIPLGLWAISPARKRDIVMKSFVCFMIFLNMVSVFHTLSPFFICSKKT